MQNELRSLDLDSTRGHAFSEPCTGAVDVRDQLRGAIRRAEQQLEKGRPARIALALEDVARAIEKRMTDPVLVSFDHVEAQLHPATLTRWQHRLRKRYAVSLSHIERLIQRAGAGHWSEVLYDASRREFRELHRIETLEDRATLDVYWTDLGVGD